MKIKWQDDGKYYSGVVSKLNNRRREFEVIYDDGSVEILSIDTPDIKLVNDE